MTDNIEDHVSQTAEGKGGTSVGEGDYVIKQGDCISSIAKDRGHFWQTIWNHPANAALKRVRKTPNVLMPGDRLTIPPLRVKQEQGATEQKHRFRRRGEPSALRLRVLECGEPVANERYVLKVDGELFSGTTDGQGRLFVPIPGIAREGELRVGERVYQLALGGIDPLSEISGIQSRLANLRYNCEVTGRLDQQTFEALNRFRQAAGLPASDTIDDETRDALEHWHDDMQGQADDEVDSDAADVEDEDADLKPASHEPSEEGRIYRDSDLFPFGSIWRPEGSNPI